MNDTVHKLGEAVKSREAMMVTPRTGRPLGRPSDAAKVDAIVEAAWTLFLANGVEAVPVERIARESKVSKVTFYKHFPDKFAVFEACMKREVERIEAVQQSAPSDDIHQTLRQFGLGLLGFLFSDPAIDFYSHLVGDLRRHKNLAQIFYQTGPGRTWSSLIALLRVAHEQGDLVIVAPEQAAEHLFGLWQGFSNLQLSLGVERERIRSSLVERVDAALEVFWRAYAKR